MNEFTELIQYDIDPGLAEHLEEDFCRSNDVILLRGKDGGSVVMGTLSPDDKDLVSRVEDKTGLDVKPVQLNEFEIDKALLYSFTGKEGDAPLPLRLSSVRERIVLEHNRKIEFQRDQEPEKIAKDTLSSAVARKATDIHIEIYSNDVDLRFRVDGILHQITTPMSLANVRPVISYIKVLADLDIAEHRNPQNGHIEARYIDKENTPRRIGFRISILPSPFGEDLVMRVLDKERMKFQLSELGISKDTYEQFHELIHKPGGMLLVTGPTASGKTTTLYSTIEHINTVDNKIITAEDPIEYEIPKVNQKQITDQLTFSDYTRNFMRQNPDVIMIGEIRDEETVNAALRASQIGHLVLSTVHTRDAASAVERMIVLGVDNSLLASLLLGALSQRLVRKICPECKQEVESDPFTNSLLPEEYRFDSHMKGVGCEECNGTGFKGQAGIFELLYFDKELRQHIARGKDISAEDIKREISYTTLFDNGMEKVRQGITTPQEILRVVPIPEQGRQ